MMSREVPLGGLFMVNCHQIQRLLHRSRLTDPRGMIADSASGGCAGCINWVMCMPFDVIKSRYQSDMAGKYKGIVDCARQSFKAEGYRVFFRGTLVTCARAFPVNAANTFVVFQTMKLLQESEQSL